MEQALLDMRVDCPSLSPRSITASSALLMVDVGSVEVTKILREVCEDG
jgi:hypothetical protein